MKASLQAVVDRGPHAPRSRPPVMVALFRARWCAPAEALLRPPALAGQGVQAITSRLTESMKKFVVLLTSVVAWKPSLMGLPARDTGRLAENRVQVPGDVAMLSLNVATEVYRDAAGS